MNPAADAELQQQQTVSDDQFAKALEQQQREAAQSPVLEAAIDETERRARERILTQAEDFKHKQRLANLFARSGCFADLKGSASADQAIAQAFVKITLGEAMGFSAPEAMQGVNLIQGTPSISAQLRAARMQRAGFSWQIDWFKDQNVCVGCRLWLYRDGKPMLKPVRDPEGNPILDEQSRPRTEHVSVSFMKADAEMLKTKIWEGSGNNRTSRTASVLEKDNWKNTPQNMYFARAVTNAQRWYAPGVLSGDIPSTEEVYDGGYEPGTAYQTHSETVGEVRDRKIEEARAFYASQGIRMPGFVAKGEVPNPTEPRQTKPEEAPQTQDQPNNPKHDNGSGSNPATAGTGETAGAHPAGTCDEIPAASTPGQKPKLQFGGNKK